MELKYLILCFSEHKLSNFNKNMQNKQYLIFASVTATPGFTKTVKIKKQVGVLKWESLSSCTILVFSVTIKCMLE